MTRAQRTEVRRRMLAYDASEIDQLAARADEDLLRFGALLDNRSQVTDLVSLGERWANHRVLHDAEVPPPDPMTEPCAARVA